MNYKVSYEDPDFATDFARLIQDGGDPELVAMIAPLLAASTAAGSQAAREVAEWFLRQQSPMAGSATRRRWRPRGPRRPGCSRALGSASTRRSWTSTRPLRIVSARCSTSAPQPRAPRRTRCPIAVRLPLLLWLTGRRQPAGTRT